MRAVLVLALFVACGESAKPQQPPAPAPAPTAKPEPPAPVAAKVDPQAPAAPTPPAPAPPPAPTKQGFDFIDDAKKLYRVAGCGGEGPLPEELAKYQKVVDKHCKELAPSMKKYQKAYFEGTRAWFDEHVPADIPSTVVYLFSGADLISALVAFPKASEITSVSLELAGDPRRLPTLTPAELDSDLGAFRREIGLLIEVGSNSSKNLSSQQRRFLPGQVSSFLLGLAVGGYEPVALRYFKIDDSGAMVYLEEADIKQDTKTTTSLRATWNKPAFAESFRNVELQYRKIGETTVHTHRHIAWNMEDKYLAEHPGLLKHLGAKGKVTILVKGGSYLLWLSEFKTIRQYILDHLAWMLSDSTGVPPTYAKPAGMVQEPYGRYNGPVDEIKMVEGSREDLDTKALFKNAKPMPFRFGYLDKENHNHVMITHPK